MPAAAPAPAADIQNRQEFHLSLAPARAELGEAVTTGRLSLAVLLAMTLGLVGFYIATRNVQGGG
jgi:hypothetical protein